MSFGSIIVFINIDKDKNIIINGGPDKEGGFSYNSDGTVTLGEEYRLVRISRILEIIYL